MPRSLRPRFGDRRNRINIIELANKLLQFGKQTTHKMRQIALVAENAFLN